MAIITYGSTPDRGVGSTLTLNKTDLASLSSVSGDAYYSDQNNWERIILYFSSDNSGQKEIVFFDASESSPTSNFLVSDKSRGDFLIDKLIIKDFDGGIFQVLRDELNTAEFDVTFGITSDIAFDPSFTYNEGTALQLSNNNRTVTLITNSDVAGAESWLTSQNLTGDLSIYVEYVIDVNESDFNMGFTTSSSTLNSILNNSGFLTASTDTGNFLALGDGRLFVNTTQTIATINPYSNGDIVSLALRRVGSTVTAWLGRNGVWTDGDPNTLTGGYTVNNNTNINCGVSINASSGTQFNTQISIAQSPTYTINGFTYIGI